MKRFSIFQKHKATGNMTWYGRISEDGLFHVVSLGTKKESRRRGMARPDERQEVSARSFRQRKARRKFGRIVAQIYRFLRHGQQCQFCNHQGLPASNFLLSGMGKGTRQKPSFSGHDKDAVDFSTLIATRYAPKTAGEIIKLTKPCFRFRTRFSRLKATRLNS